MHLILPATIAAILLIASSRAAAVLDLVDPAASKGAFPLVAKGRAAPVCIPPRSAAVVRIAGQDLASDIERVTGVRPAVLEAAPESGPRIEVSVFPGVADRWETFRLSATNDCLAIQGSDKRALAFGLYDLSRRIGVSPWHWWADVPVVKRSEVYLAAGTGPVESPSVRYRGIFLNDEGWGLVPWAAKTFEPEVGNVGPKTYARIFELLLRLRANTIWPAMHPGTTPFHQVPGNAKVADDYAIVLGSSHAEPMLRNNVGEWKRPPGQYNFLTHRETVLDYWDERVRQRTKGESLFTLGMRGIHDSPIVGPKSQAQRISILEEIFKEQRAMLGKHLKSVPGSQEGASFSQIFCPYKEVLDDYRAGLKVPDDVTIVWPDDNFGYIRRFATPEERKRSGGLGVYYHLSYLGTPMSWLWFDSLSPSLVWSEMTRAYEQGARAFWVGNVGDLKGQELSTEFFLHLAWNAGRTTPEEPARFLRAVAARDFGEKHAEAIAAIWARHQHLAVARKPEHLQWHLPLTPYRPTELTEGEMLSRLNAYAALEQDTDAIASGLPAEFQDAYYQRVGYAVAAAAAANERYFRAELARLHRARDNDEDAQETFAVSKRAGPRMDDLTRRYNEEIAGGKWRHIVRVNGIKYEDWKKKFLPADAIPPLDSSAQNAVHAPDPGAVGKAPVVPTDAHPGDFLEVDGVVSMDAGHFTACSDMKDGAGWRSISGLGRTGSAVTVLPSTAAVTGSAAPRLSYRFHVVSRGQATIRVRLLPTHPLVPGQGLRLALAVDKGRPLPLAVTSGFDTDSEEWKQRVLTNATHATVKLPEDLSPGLHTLHLVAVDTGVVVDKIVIDLGGLRPSYDGPPETRTP